MRGPPLLYTVHNLGGSHLKWVFGATVQPQPLSISPVPPVWPPEGRLPATAVPGSGLSCRPPLPVTRAASTRSLVVGSLPPVSPHMALGRLSSLQHNNLRVRLLNYESRRGSLSLSISWQSTGLPVRTAGRKGDYGSRPDTPPVRIPKP